MAQNTFALMTNLGRAKEAAAIANGTAVVVTHIAIGDGLTVPSGGETALYHEVARKAISGHGTVVGASNVAYFDIFLEASEGPYTIREAGLFDQDGDLIAIARYDPPISKPIPSSGQTVEGTIRLEVAFSNIANITIVVDPSFKIELPRLTRLPWIPIISMALADPPATPSIGDIYLVPFGATGAWAGQEGKIAEYTTAGWSVVNPPDGHGISLPDGRIFERVSGVYVEKPALDVQSGKWSYAEASGTANALTATLSPVPEALTPGLIVLLRISVSNTGATTLNLNALGIKSIVNNSSGAALSGGELVPNRIVELIYDGTAWRLLSVSHEEFSNAGSFGVAGSLGGVGTTNWTVPSGVTRVKVRCWGGGGGGGGSQGNPSAAAGGGGGGYCEGIYSVIPGQVIPVTAGAAGLGGAAGTANPGADGGSSSFGSYCTANGGGRGGAAPTNTYSSAPGSGGSTNSFGNVLNQSGMSGSNGINMGAAGLGGGGGSSFGSAGSHPTIGQSISAISPGGGGGGGANGGAGAAGGGGVVVLEW